MSEFEIDVLGVPAPKGSSRAMMVGGRPRVIPGSSSTGLRKLHAWDKAIRDKALERMGRLKLPLFVSRSLVAFLDFRLPRPKGHTGKRGLRPSAPAFPATKPDLDKLTRATLDPLTGLVYDDDSRIVEIHTTKTYANPGQEGARIEIHPI